MRAKFSGGGGIVSEGAEGREFSSGLAFGNNTFWIYTGRAFGELTI